MQVDLLIRAHDCFSIGCNIDGIATVLELAHKLTDTLNNEKEFKLMVSFHGNCNCVTIYNNRCDY